MANSHQEIQDYREECIFAATRRRNKDRSGHSLERIQARLSRIENLLPRSNRSSPAQMHERGPEQGSSQDGEMENPVQQLRSPLPVDEVAVAVHAPSATPTARILPGASENSAWLPPTPSMTTAQSTGEDDGSCCVPPEEEMSYEYHGKGSFLSICSKSGIEWVCQKTGSSDFAKTARQFTYETCRRLKLETIQTRDREPEPAPEDAWRYTQAFFDECAEGMIGLIHRPNFEARLRAQFEQGQPSSADQDPAWYALRNVVYATGWRLLSWKHRFRGFRFDEGAGWKYFRNALSVHSELLYCRTSLMAIQALGSMSIYVESIGTPSVDYMLCVNAMKLAESKGLHRQPANAWNLSPSAVRLRSRLWWAIYIYERHIAFRSGRPLSIEDDEITCQLPSGQRDDDSGHLEYLCSAARHAQISAQIARRLKTLKNCNPTFEDIVKTMGELQETLEKWFNDSPASVKIDPVTSTVPPDCHPHLVVYLLFAYYGSLISIHSLLVHPWNAIPLNLGPHEKEKVRSQVHKSTEVVVGASRNIIRNSRLLHISPSSPKSLVYVFPLWALISLFVHVLQYPERSTVDSDIELMYMVSGRLSYLEFASADLQFPFARDLTNLASMAVAKARAHRGALEKSKSKSDHETAGQTVLDIQPSDLGLDAGLPPLEDTALLNPMDWDDERWGTLLCWPDSGNSPLIDIMANLDGGADFSHYV
ncbi:uncharacterized protein PV07_00657 [Cladophialophora immunda]|uniref:Xylanolytic transcriptional activator regulatory domain-containing protein n=1 Tax=Cladophialophora immunda TaxID=569365 RepID=A0A0D2CRK6_9EURO|nr:uncharacterized protein PV07_00657 [Cladophialophora immunda]KIW33838.1 hypothetical protein PV07_00657 [Cladophialophora immunda]